MKKIRRQIMKRITAVVMSVVMVFSMVIVSPQRVEAGAAPASSGIGWTQIAMSAIKGSLIWGLGKAQDATNNDSLASLFGLTRQLVAGKQRILAEQTLDIVKEMAAELDALYKYTVTSTNEIEDMIKKLASNQAKDAFNNNAASPVDTFSNQYDRMVSEFNNLINAYITYNSDPTTENQQILVNYYNTIYNTYFKGKDMYDQVDSLFTVPLEGDSSHAGLLTLISPYNPNQNIEQTSDMTDPNTWQWRTGASVETTYLGYYYNYITTVTDYQNNVYDSMSSAALIVDNAAYLYLQAYRYFCEFQAMLITNDTSLSESEQRTQTTALWNGFNDASQKLARGINQMYDTQSTVFTTYMRTYDVATTKRIRNWAPSVTFYNLLNDYETANGYKGIDIQDNYSMYTLYDIEYSPSIIEEYQHVYQFRLVSNPDNVYVIRSSSGTTNDTDDASRVLYARDLQMQELSGTNENNSATDETGPSTDLLYALKGLENGFDVPISMSELNALAASPTYQSSQLLTTNIASELSFGLGADNVHLPQVDDKGVASSSDDMAWGPNYLVLRTNIEWELNVDLFRNYDADMVLGNVSYTFSDSNQAKLDLEDVIRDHSSYAGDPEKGKDPDPLYQKEAVVMWLGKPSYSLGLSASDGGSASLTVGGTTLQNGDSTNLASGTAATLSVTPQDGYTIDSIKLLDKDGNVLDEIFADVVLSDDTTITTQELLESSLSNADGSYEFALSAPYQNATVSVSFRPIDASLEGHAVTLNDAVNASGSYDAVLQFGAHDYLSTKNFKEGEQVVVSVTGYNHNIPDGITFAEADGTPVDIAYEDITSDFQLARPSERLYAFTMPAQDIQVSAYLGKAHTVSVLDSDHVTHTFENLNLVDLNTENDWAHADELDYVYGDTVTISYAASTGYMVSQIEIFDNNRSLISAVPSGSSVSFTMPSTDLIVRFYEEEILVHERTLTLNSTSEYYSLQFINEYGDDLNLVSKQYAPDDTVAVRLRLDPAYTVDELVLTIKGSTDNIFSEQNGTYDPETGVVTLSMPSSDAELHASIRQKTQAELDGLSIDEDGRIVISTYEELVTYASVFCSHPEYYTVTDVVLANNIDARGKDSWRQGIGSYDDACYFNATFDGCGYCIIGMDLACDLLSGLFEVVGENGVVKNLFMFDCDSQYQAYTAGGIAAYNYGRIEYCVNGANLTDSVYVNPDTGDVVSLEGFNSYVFANNAGGIVGLNFGTIYACRSAADVYGAYYAGGIAEYNRSGGTISNCASTGTVYSTVISHDDYSHYGSGGICAENSGTILGGYVSAKVTANDIAGIITAGQYGTIVDTYYLIAEGMDYAADFYQNTETNVNGLTLADMTDASFIDLLSATESNSVTWVRSDNLNGGLPRIANPSAAFADIVFESNSIRISGNVHNDASLVMTRLATNSEAWELLAGTLGGYRVASAYICTIEDSAGNQMPGEYWTQSPLTYTVPVSSPDVVIRALGHDGSMQPIDAVTVTKTTTGYEASFTTDAQAFMVLEKEGSSEPNKQAENNMGNKTPQSGLAKTGDEALSVQRLALMSVVCGLVALGGGYILRRRRSS